MHPSENSRCTWCGSGLEPGDGYRAAEVPGARRASFCRLEHIVPWAIQGARWEAGEVEAPPPGPCSRCGQELSEVYVALVRHRGEHRIFDVFCSVDHMAEWAKAGGRWARGG